MTAPTLTRPLPLTRAEALRPTIELHRRAVMAVDLVMITAAVVLTVLAQAAIAQTSLLTAVLSPAPWVLIGVWMLMLAVGESRDASVLGHGLDEYWRVTEASILTFLTVAAGHFVFAAAASSSALIVPVLVGTAALYLGRSLLRRQQLALTAEGVFVQRVLVVAGQNRAQELTDALADRVGGYQPYRVAGAYYLDGLTPADPSDIVAHAHSIGADTILYAPTEVGSAQWTRRLTWALEGTGMSLLISPSVREIGGQRLSVEQVEGMAVVRVAQPEFSFMTRVAKRTVDIIGASIGLLVLGLPMLVIGVMIRRDSEGPAIFKQVRAGLGSETFECWKFRTMRTGADAERAAMRAADDDSATFKMVDDPRITKIGHVLRRYSIDELPQLVNVLRGEMSLVGPRPHPMDDVQRYDEVAYRRLNAKPGMTGLWQVSGRSDLEWEKAVGLDLFYVENWSLMFDLMILARTVKVVFTGSGAY